MEPLAKRYLLSWLFVASSLQVTSLHFAEATYICTAYLNVSFIDSVNNETVWRQEESGLYGQQSPKVTVMGDVYLPDPIYSCESNTFYDVPSGSKGWIALIQRGQLCSFSEKINVAASKGAIAAVIFNDLGTDNRVIQMSHPGTEGMVAIMIGHRRGMEIVELIRQGIPVSMTIEVGKQHGPWMSHYSVFFVSISFFVVTAATVGYFIFYSARRLNSVRLQNRKQKRLKAEAKKAIGQLQVRTVKRGDEETGPDADTCAVCIDAYKSGDVLTILTCNHFFHKTCIEPWLLEHRTCPMCKCDILKALGVEQPEEEHPSHQVTMPPDMRSYPSVPVPDDTRGETASSGYASSGYASVQGTEKHSSPADETHTFETLGNYPDPGSVQVAIQPHYDNLAFEGDSQNQLAPRT
ncbi:E3 ubiquitin-protein ligase RNF128a precursor [Salmo salar]|uniref:E3 ubiquitin-protein ligase RNF128 n=1 Tax=Salmo salar TaxID=8030 RepID=B5X2U6_SALSA|nr:E3 ubiquitin-protein ligase RNF128a precursor [Salmo salar]ACI33627.1 E3 ubiquitin-protein ligase RNF128 precursor [Salmo salar]|eukprot:NP_001133644.1 E3 ubiquitin-protein ligase RNF128 precursor [Salmo salar]